MTRPSRRERYLYYASTALCGGALGLVGAARLRSNGLGVVPVLLVIGALCMTVGSILGSRSDPPGASVPDRRLVWISAGGAALAVVGSALTLLD